MEKLSAKIDSSAKTAIAASRIAAATRDSTISINATENIVKIGFTTKVPLTESTVKKLTRDAVDIEKTYEIVKKLKIRNKLGLHGRPLAKIVRRAESFKSQILIEKDGEEVNTKHILSMLTLAMENGNTIKLRAKGVDPNLLESEVNEFLKFCDDTVYEGERLFDEQKITVDTSRAVDLDDKLKRIDEKIGHERDVFMILITCSAEHYSGNGGLSEDEFKEIASQFRALANIKGIRNDILKLMQQSSFEPETNVEIYMKDSGTAFHLIGKDGVSRIIKAQNASDDLIAQFNHMQISRPIEEFSNEIFGILNGAHAYEVKRLQNNLALYYDALEGFLDSPIEEFKPSFKKALKKRMQYEHHRFIGIKHSNA
jgi:phosphotransferase system HPr (HPr) family protein